MGLSRQGQGGLTHGWAAPAPANRLQMPAALNCRFAPASFDSYDTEMLWRSPAPRPPGFIEPCLPTLARTVPTGPQWVHEIKHDGFRFICRRDGDRVRVFSRNGKDWTDRVPLIAEALAALRA